MVDQLVSKRLNGIGEYYFSQKLREIDMLNKQGQNILNLGIGSPDLNPPVAVKNALIQALDDPGYHRYQSYKGLPELRNAFANWYDKFYGVNLEAEKEILPLIGSKEGVMHVCMSLLNEGDKVLILNPGYPTYASAVKLAGGIPVPYSLNEENGYVPDIAELESLDLSDVKMMWINYPHMPTGKAGSTEIFETIRNFCRNHQLILINDNPYSFTLTEEPVSLLKNRSSDELVLELNSLSKSHNMAGWRVGVLSGNAELINNALIFKSNMDSGMFKPVMQAAIEALGLKQAWYDSLNEKYKARRELVYQIAKSLGCEYDKTQVGMFLWTRIPEGEISGEKYADWLLEKYRIFVPPGMIFGSEGDQHIRFSLCSQPEILNEVIERINE